MIRLLLLFALAAPSLVFGQAHHYTQVGGVSLADGLPSQGGIIQLVHQAAPSDTLDVWVQDAGPGQEPSYDWAEHADRVMWCYPNLHPHRNHLMPDAEGKLLAFIIGDSVIFTEEGSQTHTVYSQRTQ